MGPPVSTGSSRGRPLFPLRIRTRAPFHRQSLTTFHVGTDRQPNPTTAERAHGSRLTQNRRTPPPSRFMLVLVGRRSPFGQQCCPSIPKKSRNPTWRATCSAGCAEINCFRPGPIQGRMPRHPRRVTVSRRAASSAATASRSAEPTTHVTCTAIGCSAAPVNASTSPAGIRER